jgi:flagellin
LASGLRINRAADDAAGLAIAETLDTRVRQYSQEVNNLQSGVNYLQTAEGGLSNQQEGLQRVRELAVQAANGTLSDEQRAALNQEAQQILDGIDETAANTEFNGTLLLDGSAAPVPLGTEGDIEVEIAESTTSSLGLGGLDVTTESGAEAAIGQVDTALERISANRAALGAQENRLVSAIEAREVASENSQAAESQIRDLEYARAVVEQTRNQVLLQGGVGIMAQANVQRQNVLGLLGP